VKENNKLYGSILIHEFEAEVLVTVIADPKRAPARLLGGIPKGRR